MKVVIAEKPSVARDLARVLKASSKKDGYFEGNGYQVTWAIGHLVQLAAPSTYGWEKWRAEDLPMIPERFKLIVSEDTGIRKQFNIIKQLFQAAESIIVATDAGREGELIFRYIYTLSGCKKTFQRLWISSMTDKAIDAGFKAMKEGKDYDPLYYSGRCRNEADWLVGMNASRAITIKSQASPAISLGRVQTPTLALVCRRFLENKNFDPSPFFDLTILLTKEGKNFTAKHIVSFKKDEEAEAAKVSLKETAECIKADKKKKVENPPLLFDLTSLQQEANKKLGLSAQRTLEIAQELYEVHKLTTYPRTGSRYLSDDLYPYIPDLIKNISVIDKFKPAAEILFKDTISKRPFNNAKVTDHHAIIPTEKSPEGNSMGAETKQVYELIVTRFLSAFSQPCQKDVTVYDFLNSGLTFRASGTVIVFQGWRNIETEQKDEEKEADQDPDQTLPLVEVGEVLPSTDAKVDKKFTKPKPLFTEATLLRMMETAGKELENDELKEAMKECGLGTPATRASIIETLFKREYLTRDKKKLVPTDRGLQVYEIIKDKAIGSAELTGKWERDLNLIVHNNASPREFLEGIKKYTSELVADFLHTTMAVQSTSQPKNLIDTICPKCTTHKLDESPKLLKCSSNDCDFKLWKEMNKKILPAVAIKALLAGQETSIIKGFKTKEGKSFDASIFLKEDFSASYKFAALEVKDTKFLCPKCSKALEAKGKLISCSSTECDFKIWEEVAGKKLPEEIIKELLEGKVTEKLEGFKSKAGKKFAAKLELKDNKVNFVFN